MHKLIIKTLVLFGSHVAHIISIGMCLSFGVLYSELRSEFQMSQSEAAWSASIFNGVLGVVGIPLGVLVPKVGERLTTVIGTLLLCTGMITSSFVTKYQFLYVTYGLIAGAGSGIIHYCASVIILRHFDSKWRPFAVVVGNSGAAVSALVMPPFMVACITAYNWKVTFILLGCTCVVGLLCAATFMNPEPNTYKASSETVSSNVPSTEANECKVKPEGSSTLKETFVNVFYNMDFIIFFTSTVMTFLVMFNPATFLPDLMHESYISDNHVALCIMCMGCGNLAGRIIVGVVGSRFNAHVQLIHGVMLVGYTLTTFTVVFANNLTSFIIFSTLLGVFSGGYFGLVIEVVANHLTTQQAAVGFGLLITANGISSTAGMPIAGLVTDQFGSERGSFIFSSSVMMLALIVLCFIKIKHCVINKYGIKYAQDKQSETDNKCVVISVSTYI